MDNYRYNLKIKLICLLFFSLIIFYRSPYILLNGRFVSEEGYIFFKNSFENGALFGFFQIFLETGYLNIWANIASVIALIPPLEFAPLVTVYLSLSLKIYILIFVLFSDSYFFKTLKDRIIICLVILISPLMVPEIWLNTLNSMSYFGILTILIFFQSNTNSNFLEKLSPYILFLSGLSSLYSSILAPFFLIKYYLDRNKSNFHNFIFITLSAITQFIIIIYTKFNGLIFDYRSGISLDKIINYCYNVIAKSLLGREINHYILKYINDINHLILLSVILISLFIFFLYFFLKHKDRILYYLISFFIVESFLILIGSWNDEVQGRYAAVPGVLLIIIFYRLHQLNRGFLKFFFFLMVLNTLVIGAYEFKIKTIYPSFLSCIDCPIWKDEVYKWRLDQTYKMKIWNYPGKSMMLSN